MPRNNMTTDEENFVFGIEGFRDRVSSLLLEQFRSMLEEGIVNIPAISDEMKFLEGIRSETSTKKASKFKRGKLEGFWHKHYFNGDMGEQAINFLKIFNNGDAVQRIIQEAFERSSGPEELSKELSKKFVAEQFSNISRSNSWTGSWLIYKPYNGKNYYLMVAPHTKEGESGDDIFDAMHRCCHHEFPFLFNS